MSTDRLVELIQISRKINVLSNLQIFDFFMEISKQFKCDDAKKLINLFSNGLYSQYKYIEKQFWTKMNHCLPPENK